MVRRHHVPPQTFDGLLTFKFTLQNLNLKPSQWSHLYKSPNQEFFQITADNISICLNLEGLEKLLYTNVGVGQKVDVFKDYKMSLAAWFVCDFFLSLSQ